MIVHYLYMHLRLARSLLPSSSEFFLIFHLPLLPHHMVSPSRLERSLLLFFEFLNVFLVFRQMGEISPAKGLNCDWLLSRLAFFLVMICVFLFLIRARLHRAHQEEHLAIFPFLIALFSQLKNCQVDFTFPFLSFCSNLRINQ